MAGPWLLRRTKHRDAEGEAQVNADHHEPSGTDGQGGEGLDRSSDDAPWTNAGVVETRRGPPQSLWMEIMDATGEDINQGELPPAD